VKVMLKKAAWCSITAILKQARLGRTIGQFRWRDIAALHEPLRMSGDAKSKGTRHNFQMLVRIATVCDITVSST
jgi:hypothetical protein